MTAVLLKVTSASSDYAATPWSLVAEVYSYLARSTRKEPRLQRVVLRVNEEKRVDVDPGHVFVQLRLPSGDTMSAERDVAGGKDEPIAFPLKSSRHEWLASQQVLSMQIAPSVDETVSFDQMPPLVERVRIHRGYPNALQVIEVPFGQQVTDGASRFMVESDLRAVSVTIDDVGDRALVELVIAGEQREIVSAPTPWLDENLHLAQVQLVLERTSDGGDSSTRADVLVKDPVLSSVLAYYATGNRSATNDLSSIVEQRASAAVMAKEVNPIAGIAGVLVLRTLKRKLPTEWLENLERITGFSDGAVLLATHLLESSQTRDRSRIRELLIAATNRGIPVFAESGRLLRDGLRRLCGRKETEDTELLRALDWAGTLAEASRSDTIMTWLAGTNRQLHELVPSVVPAPPEHTAPLNAGVSQS